VATSGTAARGEHLYDPRSGTPSAAVASVTVVGPSLERADVLATAAFVAGETALDTIPAGYEGLRIDLDGRLSHTAGWNAT
jgi:thiamine biosynthesis lipoprotein